MTSTFEPVLEIRRKLPGSTRTTKSKLIKILLSTATKLHVLVLSLDLALLLAPCQELLHHCPSILQLLRAWVRTTGKLEGVLRNLPPQYRLHGIASSFSWREERTSLEWVRTCRHRSKQSTGGQRRCARCRSSSHHLCHAKTRRHTASRDESVWHLKHALIFWKSIRKYYGKLTL
jgi:hypothetical protein